MNCYITLRKFCSLPKKLKLELKTQIHMLPTSQKNFHWQRGCRVIFAPGYRMWIAQIANKGITMEA